MRERVVRANACGVCLSQPARPGSRPVAPPAAAFSAAVIDSGAGGTASAIGHANGSRHRRGPQGVATQQGELNIAIVPSCPVFPCNLLKTLKKALEWPGVFPSRFSVGVAAAFRWTPSHCSHPKSQAPWGPRGRAGAEIRLAATRAPFLTRQLERGVVGGCGVRASVSVVNGGGTARRSLGAANEDWMQQGARWLLGHLASLH